MIVSWKTEISLHFFSHDTCKKLSNFWQKYFGKLVKIQVWVSRGTILRNKIFEKERSFSLFSYFEQKLLGLLARNCQNCRLRVQRNNCGMFFGKFSLFYDFPNLSEELSSCWQKNFGRLVKSAIWVSRGTFLGETTFLKKYMYFLMVFGLRAIFIELWREYFSTVVRIEFCVSRGRVWTKIYFFENVLSFSFS